MLLNKVLHPLLAVLTIAPLLLATPSQALAQDDFSFPAGTKAWSLSVDNDLLAASDQDQDYTGGISLGFSGESPGQSLSLVNRARSWLTTSLGINSKTAESLNLYSNDYGFALFTPSDISSTIPINNQHPYASLFFTNATQQIIRPQERRMFTSSLTFGMLGLPVAEDIQKSIHESTSSDIPRGWNNQISEGGELTAKYAIGVQRNILSARSHGLDADINLTGQGTVGFNTGVSAGIHARFGLIRKPWWTFNPHQSEYVNLSTPSSLSTLSSLGKQIEVFAHLGANAKYRLYSTFLQGQFRNSAVTYDANELEPLLLESWAGLTAQFSDSLGLELFIRNRSASIKADRNSDMSWGGLAISFNTN